ncbi:MAG: hypothetical protein PHV07_09375 [Oscillospiraceae bacterium]|nr:hypothetical protein [Oscillospiraceae bacterium]
MKTKIVRSALTLVAILMVTCAFVGCNADKAEDDLSSTISKVTSGTASTVSNITSGTASIVSNITSGTASAVSSITQ